MTVKYGEMVNLVNPNISIDQYKPKIGVKIKIGIEGENIMNVNYFNAIKSKRFFR